jgi:hypothetical protein
MKPKGPTDGNVLVNYPENDPKSVVLSEREFSGFKDIVSYKEEGFKGFNFIYNVPKIGERPYTIGDITRNYDAGKIYEDSGLKSLSKKIVEQQLNLMVMAYGPSGSGKTYNMIGSQTTPGIIYYLVQDITRRQGITVELQGMQTYMGNIYKVNDKTRENIIGNDPVSVTEIILDKKPGAASTNAKKINDYIEELVVYGNNKDILMRKYLKQAFLYYLRPSSLGQEDITNPEKFKSKVQALLATDKLEKNNISIESIEEYLNSTIKNIKVSMQEFDPEWLQKNKVEKIDEIEKKKITGTNDLINYLDIATKNRLTRKTKNNPVSSRSHLFLLFTLTIVGQNPVKLMVADLAGSENPFEYCGIAAIEGFYILNSLNQIKTSVKSYSECKKEDISRCTIKTEDAGTRNGLLFNPLVNMNFDKQTSRFNSDLAYVGGAKKELTDIKRVLVKEIFEKQIAITYTFLNIKGYVDNTTLNLKQDLIDTLKMVEGLKKIGRNSNAFGQVRNARRRTSRKRTSRKRFRAVKHRASQERKKRISRKTRI